MNKTLRAVLGVVLCVPAILTFGTYASFACSLPPQESINLTWPPSANITVYVDSQVNNFNAVTNAVNNWNNGNLGYCYPPLFTFGAGTGQAMWVFYGTINPPPGTPPGTVVRGLTTINSTGRITSATTTINSNIPLGFPNVMTEVMAHEMGHTMGLDDCNYSGATPNPCPIYSTVMENNAPIPEWTGTEGQPGPTYCDLNVMIFVAPDYNCPAPCPDSCTPNYDNGDGTTPIDYCSYPSGCPYGYQPDEQSGCCQIYNQSPILIDTTGRGFYLTDTKEGVLFDIRGNGHPIQMGWTALGADNAFLALPGSDGLVHNGKQLFGNFTQQPKSANPNGFAALAVYDDPKNGGNGDGVIDSRDAIFSSLRLWIDANHDGISQPEELHPLPSLGVNSISLTYKADERTDQYGNVFRYRAQVNPGDATNTGRMAYDVFFVGPTPRTAGARSIIPAGGRKCSAPTNKLGMLAPVSGSLR
jgi:hypothetical protein